MAGRGPVPKPNAVRRNKQPERTQLVASTHPRGPELPKGVLPVDRRSGERETWNAQTKKWWGHLRRSPQANLIQSDVEWDYLLDTALMHHTMWEKGRWEFANEIRMRLAKFGITPEDRLRLRVEIAEPSGAPNGSEPGVTNNVTSITDRRKRLTGGA